LALDEVVSNAFFAAKKRMRMKSKIVILIILLAVAASLGVVLSKGRGPSKAEEVHDRTGVNAPVAATPPGRMDMGPHMRMTDLRRPQPGDQERAAEIAAGARRAVEKYKDYRVALRDGYKILLPNVPQKMYHFNNLAYWAEAERKFNVEHPTSLLYEKGRGGYRLIGLMYTAPAQATEDELNARIPLSVAEWHQHVNVCLRSSEPLKGLFDPSSRFGLDGTITTRDDCAKAGGYFFPQLLGWMVHLYPYEKTAEEMWSVERQMAHGTPHAH
jgi:hypothetical protein